MFNYVEKFKLFSLNIRVLATDIFRLKIHNFLTIRLTSFCQLLSYILIFIRNCTTYTLAFDGGKRREKSRMLIKCFNFGTFEMEFHTWALVEPFVLYSKRCDTIFLGIFNGRMAKIYTLTIIYLFGSFSFFCDVSC